MEIPSDNGLNAQIFSKFEYCEDVDFLTTQYKSPVLAVDFGEYKAGTMVDLAEVNFNNGIVKFFRLSEEIEEDAEKTDEEVESDSSYDDGNDNQPQVIAKFRIKLSFEQI